MRFVYIRAVNRLTGVSQVRNMEISFYTELMTDRESFVKVQIKHFDTLAPGIKELTRKQF